jgi:Tfp pilus assembly protein PilF
MHHYAYLLPACLAVFSSNVIAAPYAPRSDAQVLERLPFTLKDPIAREMATARAELQRNPRDPGRAIRLAQRYYGLVAEEGDPRYLGYAQAALAPWWDLAEPPIEVQMLRASLRQFQHDFAGALADLTQILKRDPSHAKARAQRAIIHVVQARYPQAKTDCQALHGTASALIAIGCSAMVDALTGNAAAAYETLNSALANRPLASADEKLWVSIRLAEMAQRLGRNASAETHFKQALGLGITDTFLLAAYADFLVDQQRMTEVVALLRDKTRSDVLLLRLVFAERALGLSKAQERAAQLAARYAAAQMRGDTVHQQEEAQFALQVQHDPKKALALAQENWKVQLEPRDARIFLQAALALKDPAAAQPVLQWLQQSGIEDRYLIDLGQQLKAMQK